MSKHHHHAQNNTQPETFDPQEQTQTPEQNETAPAENAGSDLADALSAAQEQAEKYKDLYIRAQAEMENLRKRTQTELEKRSKFAISTFAADLLPVADNLKRALDVLPPEKRAGLPQDIENMLVGIDMTQKELTAALNKNGVKAVAALGRVFDPNFHKVVSETEDPTKPAGTIVQEWQTGYTIGGDRVLREAMVVVTKGGPASVPDGAEPPHTVDTTA